MAIGGVDYWATGYFHLGYWESNYWAEQAAAIVGVVFSTISAFPAVGGLPSSSAQVRATITAAPAISAQPKVNTEDV